MIFPTLAELVFDHTAVAVSSIDEYAKKLGIPADSLTTETLNDQGVKVAFYSFHNASLEIIEPLDGNESLKSFIHKRGEGALHHIGFSVSDILEELSALKERGVTLIDAAPRVGARGKLIAFIHPKASGGTLVELCQKKS